MLMCRFSFKGRHNDRFSLYIMLIFFFFPQAEASTVVDLIDTETTADARYLLCGGELIGIRWMLLPTGSVLSLGPQLKRNTAAPRMPMIIYDTKAVLLFQVSLISIPQRGL